MYTTIEADIENEQVISPEIKKLPAMAHVLITILESSVDEMVAGRSAKVK